MMSNLDYFDENFRNEQARLFQAYERRGNPQAAAQADSELLQNFSPDEVEEQRRILADIEKKRGVSSRGQAPDPSSTPPVRHRSPSPGPGKYLRKLSPGRNRSPNGASPGALVANARSDMDKRVFTPTSPVVPPIVPSIVDPRYNPQVSAPAPLPPQASQRSFKMIAGDQFPKGSWSKVYKCKRWSLILKGADGKPPGWESEYVFIRIDAVPFAKGNIRETLHGLDYGGGEGAEFREPRHIVLKRPLTIEENGVLKTKMKEKELWADVEAQTIALRWSEVFNKNNPPKLVHFLPCWMLKVEKDMFACEPFMSGKYEKHNNNYGFVNAEVMRNTPHAFSHFTWHFSKGKLLVVDMQGVQDHYTDPQIHTCDGKNYGVGNMGMPGIRRFFDTHYCNDICRALGLNSRQVIDPAAAGPTMWNPNRQ